MLRLVIFNYFILLTFLAFIMSQNNRRNATKKIKLSKFIVIVKIGEYFKIVSANILVLVSRERHVSYMLNIISQTVNTHTHTHTAELCD